MNRLVDVIIGMQFGSEGKGKIAALLANNYAAAVRVGAPNAGHSIYYQGRLVKMRSVPCAWVNPGCELFVGAGGLINLEVLADELGEVARFFPDVYNRLRIDANAGIVTTDDIEVERSLRLYEGIGSTCEGVGAAMARKMSRGAGGPPPALASTTERLLKYITNVSVELNTRFVRRGRPIMIEGTQGFGLSLNHGYYPYVTSRDVLASSMLGECGISPLATRRIIGVMRTYPIRVHGNSGPMGAEELQWSDVAKESGYESLIEKTTVTGRVRRVSHINWDLLDACVHANAPTDIALTFADYINHKDRGVDSWEALSLKTREFVQEVEARLAVPVTIISTGPRPEDTIFRGYYTNKEV